MNDRFSFYAYLATLAAIVLVCIVGGVLVALGSDIAALGIGGIAMGLIGMGGTFKPSSKPNAPIVYEFNDVSVTVKGKRELNG